MSEDVEIITEEEWFNRMLQKKMYDVLFIDWKSGATRVIEKYTGEIFDVTSKYIGGKLVLQVKRLA